MKPSTFLTALLPVAAVLAQPTKFYSGAVVKERELDKRAITGTVLVDGLRYRTCPRTSCTAVGQYPKGATISIVCYTGTDTTVVNGDP